MTSLLGARLLWVFTHPQPFRPPLGSWSDVLNPFRGPGQVRIVGLAMMGGVLLAVVSTLAFLAYHRLPVLRYADVLAPSVVLGAGITRLGCFLNGCCHGIACDYPWAVRFPEGSQAALLFPDTAVHPTQLYASGLALLSFGCLLWLARREPLPGTVFFAFLVLAGTGRIANDFFRYYETNMVVAAAGGWILNLNQLIALAFAVAGLVGLAWLARAPADSGWDPRHRASNQ